MNSLVSNSGTITSSNEDTLRLNLRNETNTSCSVSQPAAGAPTAAPAPTDPVVTGPPRARKSRLMDIAVRYGVAHEAAKLTVLEKSKIDWKIHVEEVGDADRLTHNRKDGYVPFWGSLSLLRGF